MVSFSNGTPSDVCLTVSDHQRATYTDSQKYRYIRACDSPSTRRLLQQPPSTVAGYIVESNKKCPIALVHDSCEKGNEEGRWYQKIFRDHATLHSLVDLTNNQERSQYKTYPFKQIKDCNDTWHAVRLIVRDFKRFTGLYGMKFGGDGYVHPVTGASLKRKKNSRLDWQWSARKSLARFRDLLASHLWHCCYNRQERREDNRKTAVVTHVLNFVSHYLPGPCTSIWCAGKDCQRNDYVHSVAPLTDDEAIALTYFLNSAPVIDRLQRSVLGFCTFLNESWHAQNTRFLPKSQRHSQEEYETGICLSAMEWNENVQRKVVYEKGSEYEVNGEVFQRKRVVKVEKTHAYRLEIIQKAMETLH